MFIHKNNEKLKKIKPTNFLSILFKQFDYLKYNQQDAGEFLYLLFDSFSKDITVKYTNNIFLTLMKELRYNNKIKNICAREVIINYKNEYSLINKYFDIHMISNIYCDNCKKTVSSKLEITNNINVPISDDSIEPSEFR